MEIQLTYGNALRPTQIPDAALVTEFKPAILPVLGPIEDTLVEMLDNPLGSEPFSRILAAAKPESIAIAVPYCSSSVPVTTILSALLASIFRSLPQLDAQCVKLIVSGGFQKDPDMAVYGRILEPAIGRDC